MRVSKTRFRSQDGSKEARSVSSPRLKSFPAEKIKRLNDPPAFSPEPIGALIMQQDPRETGTFFVGCPVGGNNDRGDAIATQLSPVHQQPNVNFKESCFSFLNYNRMLFYHVTT